MQRAAFLVLAVLAAAPARAQQARAFTPFFDFNISESVFVPTGKDTFFSGANLGANVGMLANMDNWPLIRRLPGDHGLFGLYGFSYDGPGFQPQDQGEFDYRSLSHNFSFEYRWKLLGPFRVRPGFGYSKSYVRSGANEAWGDGLYDSTSKGGQLGVDYLFDNGSVSGQVLQRSIAYPNFTDLLREFQGAGAQAETSGGLQDNSMKEYSVSALWKKFYASVRMTKQSYDNEKVVESNGVYGATPQETDSVSANGGFTGKLWRFEISPNATYTKFNSNQNFLQFKFFGDSSPQFFSNWYSYTELRADAPFYLNLTKAGTALTVGAAVIKRDYVDRVARDASNAATTAKQSNTMLSLNGGFRFRINEVSYMKLLGGIVNATSNNKFERYLPYNYTGTSLGISFDLAY